MKHCPAWPLVGGHKDAVQQSLGPSEQNAVLQAIHGWPLWLCLVYQQAALCLYKPHGVLGCMSGVPLAVPL